MFDGGKPATRECVTGFDNAGFLMASSGNIFGAPAQFGAQLAGLSPILDFPPITAVLRAIPDVTLDNGRVVNPFLGLGSRGGYPATKDPELALSDGGCGGENVPFFPLFAPQRALDVIIALDVSDRVAGYPDGTDVRNTYLKTLEAGYENIRFPFIPDAKSLVAQGFYKKPVLLGSSCAPQPNNHTTPLIIWLPNYNAIGFDTNASGGQFLYSKQDQQSYFDTSFAIVTHKGSKTWPACFACALIDAQQERNGVARTSQCQRCFDQYCYRGN
ncbi:hypothetical protein RQP46_004485 [Phenoliferia psychrophenolica]